MTLFELFSRVLNMSLTASVVILAVIAARFAMKKCPKVYSYILWAAVLFRLLCPVSLPSPMSVLSALDPPICGAPRRRSWAIPTQASGWRSRPWSKRWK